MPGWTRHARALEDAEPSALWALAARRPTGLREVLACGVLRLVARRLLGESCIFARRIKGA